MKDLQTTKSIKIKGDTFVFDISKMTVDDFIKIEANKQYLALNLYTELSSGQTIGSLNATHLVGMIATFRILKPEIEKDCIPTGDFLKLSFMDTRELFAVYVKDFVPWFKKWSDEFNSPFETKNEKSSDIDKNEK